MLRWFVFALCGMMLVGCNEIEEFTNIEQQIEERIEDESKKLAALKSVAKKVDGHEKFNTYFNQCPAKHFGKEQSLITNVMNVVLGAEELDQHLCSLSPELCLSICLDGDANVCLSLAQALEGAGTHEEIGTTPGRKTYALACATGSASGCTNRGGGLLNYPSEADPLSQNLKSNGYACTFELFKTGCEHNDAWGCAMLGEAYGRGQGAEKNLSVSKQKLTKACVLDAEDEACSYAKQLEETFLQSAD